MKEMLELQRTLEQKIKSTRGKCALDCESIQEKEEMTKEFVIAIVAELIETLDWINWKAWRKTRIEITPERIYELKVELIDIQHFLNNLYLIWGMDEKEIKELYEKKHMENIKRQEDGY